MPRYRYEPKDNRTPMGHPVLGELVWGETYEHPDLAGDPDFTEIGAQDARPASAPSEHPVVPASPPETPPPASTPPGIQTSAAAAPDADQAHKE